MKNSIWARLKEKKDQSLQHNKTMKFKRKKKVVSPYAFDMKHNAMKITTKIKINREVMGSCGLNLQCNATNITTS